MSLASKERGASGLRGRVGEIWVQEKEEGASLSGGWKHQLFGPDCRRINNLSAEEASGFREISLDLVSKCGLTFQFVATQLGRPLASHLCKLELGKRLALGESCCGTRATTPTKLKPSTQTKAKRQQQASAVFALLLISCALSAKLTAAGKLKTLHSISMSPERRAAPSLRCAI